ncbi:hypothetical protein SLS62_007733 [Diatrype stigma]|uniref:FAD-binding PCMH-type domain-containing protein n=1 Tax=Diatrype stigma TaxID=117547 RepID=A0AAN9UQB3_9PEZI
MEVIAAVTAWAIHIVSRNLPASIVPWDIHGNGNAAAELMGRLSPSAQVYLPGSEEFTEATTRWSVLHTPTFRLIIVPHTEDDVAEAVKYANDLNLPFLAVNGGHGAISTVEKLHNGVGIWINQLRSVEIAQDGSTVTIGGGALSKDVTDILWAAGKQTGEFHPITATISNSKLISYAVTGVCECTSILGPGLGGGHGILQGRYGLVSDQFVSMNVVMADGNIHTISNDLDADLWWAMRGAGHNFGIVTSATSKIYDIQHRNWAYETFIYTGDSIESLYTTIVEQFPGNDSQSIEILNLSVFFNNPDIDPTREGVDVVDSKYSTSFRDLGPIFTSSTRGSYTDIPTWIGQNNESPSCQKAALANVRFPIDLEFYNVTAQRKAYELFASRTQEIPALNNSMFLFEGYSIQGVKAIPSESSAYPFRMDNLLVSPLLTYLPTGAELDAAAANFGEDLRQILYEGSQKKELHTYVNYAFGDEAKESWYGYEDWRQDRLSALKRKYDPEGKFSFYAPILLHDGTPRLYQE